MQIREMEKKDIPEVFKMFEKLYSHLNDKGFALKLNTKNLEENLEMQIGSKFLKLFLLENENEIMGFINISLGKINSKFVSDKGKMIGTITELYMKEKYRGRNHAGLLIETAEAYFKLANISIVQVNTMHANDNAVRFYKRNGFETDYVAFIKNI